MPFLVETASDIPGMLSQQQELEQSFRVPYGVHLIPTATAGFIARMGDGCWQPEDA